MARRACGCAGIFFHRFEMKTVNRDFAQKKTYRLALELDAV